MSHTVYLVTNTVTGKRYVGCTSKPLENRMYHHAKRGAMAEDISRIGLHSFLAEVLHTCETKQAARDIEDAEIKRLRTHTPYGYNRRQRGGRYPGAGGAGEGNTNSRRRPVTAHYPDGIEAAYYDTVMDAAKALRIQRNTIHRAILNPHYTAGGFHWRDAG